MVFWYVTLFQQWSVDLFIRLGGLSHSAHYRPFIAPVILEIPSSSQLYLQGGSSKEILQSLLTEDAMLAVAQQFAEQWKHPTRVPTVIKARLILFSFA